MDPFHWFENFQILPRGKSTVRTHRQRARDHMPVVVGFGSLVLFTQPGRRRRRRRRVKLERRAFFFQFLLPNPSTSFGSVRVRDWNVVRLSLSNRLKTVFCEEDKTLVVNVHQPNRPPDVIHFHAGGDGDDEHTTTTTGVDHAPSRALRVPRNTVVVTVTVAPLDRGSRHRV